MEGRKEVLEVAGQVEMESRWQKVMVLEVEGQSEMERR